MRRRLQYFFTIVSSSPPFQRRSLHLPPRPSEQAVDCLPGLTGIVGVELFLLEDGSLLLNEVAPRPHNSGHYTIEACHTSQFEQHLRAVSRQHREVWQRKGWQRGVLWTAPAPLGQPRLLRSEKTVR